MVVIGDKKKMVKMQMKVYMFSLSLYIYRKRRVLIFNNGMH